MPATEEKLAVLARIGTMFDAAGICWAVGGSLMLYLRGITDVFHDIDLMVAESDALRAKELLLRLGALAPPHPAGQYQTRHFYEFTVDGVEIDLIAGFVITAGGTAQECPLLPADIDGSITVGGAVIPLHALAVWRRYYMLMGRTEKVAMIDGAAASPKERSHR